MSVWKGVRSQYRLVAPLVSSSVSGGVKNRNSHTLPSLSYRRSSSSLMKLLPGRATAAATGGSSQSAVTLSSVSNLWAVAATSLWLLASRHHHAEALPFRGMSRGPNSAAEEEEGHDTAAAILDDAAAALGSPTVVTVQRWGQHLEPATGGQRRSAVVEQYFAAAGGLSEEEDVASLELLQDVRSQAQNLTDFLVRTRRKLHQHPELMYQEEVTSRAIQSLLAEMGISFTTGWGRNAHPHVHPGPGGYGVVADLGTGGEPCVLLRADMDALPILERTEGVDDYRSRNPNCMHACGHDAHTTMLLGAIALLKRVEDSIPGTVRFMFQPAEEGGAGGKRMREEGVLSHPPAVSHAFGMHVWPTLPSGVIASRPGPLMAACDRFEILISGVGGHAAMPHLTVDPIVVGSAIVVGLQSIVSRTVSPLDSGVCSITKFEAGEAFNVIPSSALLRGTIRALNDDTLLSLRDRVTRIVESTAHAHGCNATITYSPDYYPPTVNDPELYDDFSRSVAGLVSSEGVARETEPTMGAEDFGFLAESVPSTFFFLGSGSGQNPPTHYGLHHPHFALDESVLPVGVELHVNLALRAIRRLHRKQRHRGGDPSSPAAAET